VDGDTVRLKRGDLVWFMHARRAVVARVLAVRGKSLRVSLPAFGRVDVPASRVRRCSPSMQRDLLTVVNFVKNTVADDAVRSRRSSRGGLGGL
jgi:hypothetical protein